MRLIFFGVFRQCAIDSLHFQSKVGRLCLAHKMWFLFSDTCRTPFWLWAVWSMHFTVQHYFYESFLNEMLRFVWEDEQDFYVHMLSTDLYFDRFDLISALKRKNEIHASEKSNYPNLAMWKRHSKISSCIPHKNYPLLYCKAIIACSVWIILQSTK